MDVSGHTWTLIIENGVILLLMAFIVVKAASTINK